MQLNGTFRNTAFTKPPAKKLAEMSYIGYSKRVLRQKQDNPEIHFNLSEWTRIKKCKC